jgi:DnaA family protein
MKQLLLDFTAPPAPNFGNFVLGRNAEAVAAASQFAAGLGPARVLYLWGAAGSGKSHLLSAIAEAAGASVALIIDGVDTVAAPALQPLFNAINEGARVVASGSAAPRDLSLRRDLATRLGAGLVYQLHPLSDEDKRAALQGHAQARGMKLPGGIVDYLLTHAPRAMPKLISALDTFDRYSLETGRPITLPLVKTALAQARV